jgi:hypothetical protein
MPNYDAHLKIGSVIGLLAGIGLCTAFYFMFEQVPVGGWRLFSLIPVLWFYSNLPDLDHHLGRLRRYLFTGVFVVMIASFMVAGIFNIWMLLTILTVTGVVGILLFRTRHRGLLHSYWFVLLMAVPLLLIHWIVFVVGWFSGWSHIFADRLWSSIRIKVKRLFGIKEPTIINVNIGGK